ncbi:hypothetical protein ACP8HZ_11015 [Francisella noatunensis]
MGGDKVAKEPWRMALAVCHKYDLDIPDHLKEFPQAESLISFYKMTLYLEVKLLVWVDSLMLFLAY